MCGRLQFCRGKFGFILICGMRSCVRPVAAGVIAAGLDEVRFPGSNQSIGLVVLTTPCHPCDLSHIIGSLFADFFRRNERRSDRPRGVCFRGKHQSLARAEGLPHYAMRVETGHTSLLQVG